MAWLSVALGATSLESKEGSQKPRLELRGKGISCDPSGGPCPWPTVSSVQLGLGQRALEGSDSNTLYIYSQKEGGTERDGLASIT